VTLPVSLLETAQTMLPKQPSWFSKEESHLGSQKEESRLLF
jgi:hypothetical protein